MQKCNKLAVQVIVHRVIGHFTVFLRRTVVISQPNLKNIKMNELKNILILKIIQKSSDIVVYLYCFILIQLPVLHHNFHSLKVNEIINKNTSLQQIKILVNLYHLILTMIYHNSHKVSAHILRSL